MHNDNEAVLQNLFNLIGGLIMNIFCSVTAAVLGAAAGIYFSRQLKERERIMTAAILLIKELEVQIRYTNAEIGDMLRNSADNEAYQKLLFVTECRKIEEKGNFHNIWSEGVKRQAYITERDRELLIALGERLGETDAEGQLSFLEMTEEMIKGQQQQAESDYKNKGKMYRSVGILCGLAMGIMVL